ncbi:ribosomal RNA-processing protein 7-domain-containing protein [Trametes elegans]|nr:ribosomal RNA-processing protein 7-domain-containing protein [Trametes elegans]
MGSSSSPAKSKRTAAAVASSAASSSTALPTTVSGFTVLPIAYSPSATHILYARAHSAPKHKGAKGKQKEKAALPEARTLFLVNVPPDATERELTVLFKPCGTVERVVFSIGSGSSLQQEDVLEDDGGSEDEDEGAQGGEAEGLQSEEDDAESRPKKKRKVPQPQAPQVVPLPSPCVRTLRRTGHTAYIVFLDASSLERALKPPQKPYAWPIDEDTPHGLEHYTALYTALRPPLDVVRAHADSWMEAFEHEQAKKRQESKYHKGEAVVDEDGFTLQAVPAGARRRGTGSKRRRKDKKEKKEKDAFYAFQIHEKKRKEVIDLKQKFEEDRAKIEKLKQSRKFRPY